MQVEGQHAAGLPAAMATGARVSNAYPTFPLAGNNPRKRGLMPYAPDGGHPPSGKGPPPWDGDASD